MSDFVHTVSSGREWETCKRRWRYKYVDLYRPALRGKALSVGISLHAGLEGWAEGLDLAGCLAKADAAMATDDYFESASDAPAERERVRAMLTAYFHRWTPTRDNWIIEPFDGIERQFYIELEPGLYFAGKIDLVAHHGDNLYIWDHKTTSDPISNAGEDFWQRLAIDKQIAAYSYAVKQIYGQEPRVLWDVVKKPTGYPKGKERIAKRKIESDAEYEARKAANLESLDEFRERLIAEMQSAPDEYLVRHEVYRTRQQIESALVELIETCRTINRYDGTYPRNDNVCHGKYGTCQYMSVCAGVESLDSPLFEKVSSPHPELPGLGA